MRLRGRAATLAVLKEARKLITYKENWTQGSFLLVNPESGRLRYCAVGAVTDAAGQVVPFETVRRANLVVKELQKSLPKGFTSVTYYNDSRKHRTVLRLFDRTIKRMEDQLAGNS